MHASVVFRVSTLWWACAHVHEKEQWWGEEGIHIGLHMIHVTGSCRVSSAPAIQGIWVISSLFTCNYSPLFPSLCPGRAPALYAPCSWSHKVNALVSYHKPGGKMNGGLRAAGCTTPLCCINPLFTFLFVLLSWRKTSSLFSLSIIFSNCSMQWRICVTWRNSGCRSWLCVWSVEPLIFLTLHLLL